MRRTEALTLRAQGIDFEVIPGVTAAAGCSSYAGIPLTHRGLAQGVRFITGQLQEGDEQDINWRCIADPGTTLVIYMGLANLQRICDRLQGAGLPAATPAAAIHEGTTPRQQKVVATLSTLAEKVAEAGLDSPVTTIVGEVVGLAGQLDWFGRDQRPEVGQDSEDARGRFRA